MNLLVILFVIVQSFLYLVSAQQRSVAQQCLTEQIRSSNAGFQPVRAPIGRNIPATDATLNAFRAICQNYENYIRCFQTRLPGSTVANDNFLNLIFDANNMRTAYRGLCKDLNVLQRRMQCLLTTPQIQQCYNNFRAAVIQVVNIGRQGSMQRRDLESIACNVSIARYQCETQVYAFCDQQAGEIMRNFFYAGLPGQCRQNTGVVSRYTQIWGGASVSQLTVALISLPVLVMFKHIVDI